MCLRLFYAIAQWPFLPSCSFQPKLHGAAYGKGIYLSPISSISFGYSGRNGLFLAIGHYVNLISFSRPVSSTMWVQYTLFVTCHGFHAGMLHFHLWEHPKLVVLHFYCVSVLGAGVLAVHSAVPCLPHHTLCCGCKHWDFQWIWCLPLICVYLYTFVYLISTTTGYESISNTNLIHKYIPFRTMNVWFLR